MAHSTPQHLTRLPSRRHRISVLVILVSVRNSAMMSIRTSHRHNSHKISRRDSDAESSASACSSLADECDEDVDHRIYPNWCSYRSIIQRHGFRLDTCRDVKKIYQQYWEALMSRGCRISKDLPGYLRACSARNDDELCPDMGLVCIHTITWDVCDSDVALVARKLVSRDTLCRRDTGRHQSRTPA